MTLTPSLIPRVVAVLSAASICALAQSGIPKWVEEVDKEWYAAYNAGDLSSVMKMYSEDIVAVYPEQTLRGRPALEEYFRGQFEKMKFDCTSKVEGARALQKVVVAWGSDSCRETPKSNGTPRSYKGQWISTFERQPDGSWLWVRDAYDEMK